MKRKSYIPKILKGIAIAVGSLLLLIIILILSLRLPSVQNFAKDKLVVYLEKKIKTDVQLDRVFIEFPNSLVMENLYLRGKNVDTLLSVRKFDVGLDMWQLLKSKADITSIDLEGVRARVVRDREGKFNFDYIIDAFATSDKKESSSKPFIISLDKINLKDIGVKFDDRQARNDINAYFRSFDTRVKTFDLQNNSYALNDINLDGLRLSLKQSLIEEIADEVEDEVDSLNRKKAMKLGLSGINLTDFNINYGDDNSKAFAKVIFKELRTKVNDLDLENNSFNIANVLLKGADIDANLFLASDKTRKKAPETKTGQNAAKPMNLVLGKLIFDDVKVAYNNTAVAPTRSGMDFNHLNFGKLNVDVRNFKMENNQFAGSVESAEIQEARGLNIQKFTTDFVYAEKQAYLKNLYLQTPRTVLRDEIVLNYNSIAQLSENPGAVKISANIRNSKVGFADILTFVPSLRNTAPFNTYPNGILNLDAVLNGTMNDLNIRTLKVSGLDRLKLIATGKIKNATTPDRLYYDLKIGELSTASSTLYKLLPKNTIPKNITLPSYLSVNGVAQGTTQVVNTNLKLKSTLGNAGIAAKVDLRRKNRELYNIKADLHNLQIGTIIQNKKLGAITAQIDAKGESFDFKNANATVKGIVQSADFNGYRYSNMYLNGKINRGAYNVVLNSKDPNANLQLTASGRYNEKNPSVKVNGNINKLDLNKLGFYDSPMILAGTLDGDFTNLDPDYLNGYLYLKDFAISDTKEVYPIREINLTAVSTAESNQIILQSQIADINLTGKYKLTQIFGALQQTVNSYYQFQKPGQQQRIDGGQFFTFNAKIKNDDLIRKFVPELKSFETITMDGNYNADSQKIELNAQIPQVTYAENNLENTTLRVSNENNALQYNLAVASFKNESVAINKVDVSGDVANNTINYNITTKDQKDVTQFLIAGNAKSINDVTEISLNPNGLKLNYTDWTVAENNRIQIAKQGILADNFRLSNGGSEIALQSETSRPGSPLNVTLKDFKIETITEIIKKDSLLAQGTINGTAQLRDITKKLSFTSDIKVNDLLVYGSPVGNIDVKAYNTSANIINADVALYGNNNDVKITGNYNTSASSFDLNVAMNQLQMRTLQGFTQNAIVNTEGYLSGNLKVGGTTSAPSILGTMRMNNVGLEIAKTGSDFRNINDKIDFTRRGIEFDNFKINDKDGNSLRVDGQVLTQTYTDFGFNLDVNAEDFKVLNSEKSNDAIMYGILAIDAALRVRGDLDLPKVDGRLAVTDATDFTFVLPQSSPTLQERDGIVEFIDQDQIALNKTISADSISAESPVKGLDVNVNIELNKEAKLSIIIDKANGDFVKLQGEADLTGGIDPSGKTTLVGVYQVEKGNYELSVSVLKRKFEIQQGSTITWTGEPTTANLDITAVYKADVAPIDLVEQQLAGRTTGEVNMYKQRIPFNTLLMLKGELLKPQISFDITTDEKNNAVASSVTETVDAKLDQLRQEESEMNKQVFALLLLGRFIGENPFQSNSGLSAETLARQSVSKILSQQLNNLASDLIKGVDLNFDLESSEDYSSGTQNTRTDLNVGLSKRLLNDRLKVSVGSNFGLEGEARQNENTTNIAGDVSIDYSLSRDGRYMLRAYRKNDYQVALQGQIVETGVGFIITLDYNQFQDIFKKTNKNPKKKERRDNNQAVEFK